MAAANKNDEDGIKIVCRNKRAFHEYNVLDRLECGIVLTGTEVKSLREGTASLEDAYAKLENGDDPDYQLWRNRLHDRRFRKPEVQRILEVEFEIAGAGGESQPC